MADDVLVGKIVFTKEITEDGKVKVFVDYEGLSSYEVIGILTVELDRQRASMQED